MKPCRLFSYVWLLLVKCDPCPCFHVEQKFAHSHCLIVFHRKICSNIFARSVVGGHLCCFFVAAVINCATVNALNLAFWCTYIHISVVDVPRSGTAGL